jgi:hypothetical protein
VTRCFHMPFPEKFRTLIELEDTQVEVPDYLWLAYSVCAVSEDSCGWQGWTIESAKKGNENQPGEHEVASVAAEQKCPHCGKPLYRTGIDKRYDLNRVPPAKFSCEYEIVPPSFK